jgi:hypothetical protein
MDASSILHPGPAFIGKRRSCLVCSSSADWRSSYWLVFTQLLFYPLAIVVGVAFRVDTSGPRSPHPDPLGERLLSAMVVASLVTAALWIYRMKGIRWLAGSLVLLQEIVLFGAFLVTRMSVTGDWI